jgi:hypothetical protein
MVQWQNVPLFRRLHWRSLGELTIHERSHHLMSADLTHYPPIDDANALRLPRQYAGAAS